MADGEARRRIAEELDRTFVVEAAAGTGKTTALIGRMIGLLRTGRARLEEIVAVTFTEKAAGEMKLRLRTELERAHASASRPEERARFEGALAELEAARIGTIHSFCADLLRERPVEAGVDPDLEVLSEEQERELVGRAFTAWFQEVLSDPPEGVRRMLRRRGRAREQLLTACRDLVGRRDHDAPWRREPFDRDARIDAMLEAMRGVAALASLAFAANDHLALALGKLARFLEEVDERERARARDYDGLEAELAELRTGYRNDAIWKHTGRGRQYGEGLSRQDVISRRDALADALEGFVGAAEADLAACLFRDLAPVVRAYEDLKARSGTLDFLDLLMRARDLVLRDGEVREALRARIRCIFVDEFQDTDPLQAELLLVLASEGPIPTGGPLGPDAPAPVADKLFVVGDPKQSIYRFRRADVALYERIKRKLATQGVDVLTLSTSFRATPDIQRVINAAFAPLMQGAEDGSQASYVALTEHRKAVDHRPSVVALPVPRPYGKFGKVYKKNVAASAADSVGAFLDWLLHASGITVHDPLGGERPLESRDVCLLFRYTMRFGQNLVTPYVLALEARAIPHVMVGGRAFHDREEVLALSTVLRAIEHPDDRLSVYATLRGPFFGLSDEELLVWSHERALHPLVPAPEALWARDPIADALEVLRELHVHRNRRPIADTIARFLDATRAHAGVANWPNGEQALANVLRVLELARRFEAQGAISFRGFVERLEEQLERGEGVDAPVVEERAAGVRIMTVHKAKGLEFPVVVLCDPTVPRTADQPSRWVDPATKLWAAPLAGCAPIELLEHRDEVLRADEAEDVRLTYVAATRAKDLLVVPCVGDGPEAGWVDPLHRALYPADSARRKAEAAPGCPAFGDDSVLERPEEAPFGPQRSVMPGLHRIGDARVVWWDPAVLELDRVPNGGLRGTAIFEEGEAGAERVEAHHAWAAKLDELRASGSAPSFRVTSVTKVAHAVEEAASSGSAIAAPRAPRIEEVASVGERPSGKRFGTLVHATLAECALDADRAAVEAMARHQGAAVAAPDEEVRAAAGVAWAALRHPVLREASEAERRKACRRECPITVPLDDGTSAEGVIDLAYQRTDGTWVIVDFKTDRQRGEKLTHAVQLDVYARAVAAATGAPTETVLLYV
jgi:ATP-dependent exoDNAse (exonuclease V) beta subunit